MVDSLVIPPLLAVASGCLVLLHLLFLSGPVQKFLLRPRQPSVSASTPQAVAIFDVLQLAGCFTLLGISIVVLVKEGHQNDLYLFLTFVSSHS